ncbi:hypothetical protein HRG84_18520 [Flavisolibacter sp. BT320]|nr:hypothetical protein [Flavisolibacter longurius]
MQKIRDVNQGDILTFKAADGKYKALLCTSTYKERSPQNFTFAALTYDRIEKPTIESIYESGFYGIGNKKSDYFKYSDNELQRMWTIHPEIKPYFLGSYRLTIWRKDFMKFRGNFELIGCLKVVDQVDKHGSGGMNASDWNFLQEFFNEKFKSFLPDKGQTTFKVKAILREELM